MEDLSAMRSCAAREGSWEVADSSAPANLLSSHLDDELHPAELLLHAPGLR